MSDYLSKYPGPHLINHVQITAPLTLELTFNDGVKGTVIFPPEDLNGIFSHFKDSEYFNKVIIDPPHGGVLTWPNPNPTSGSAPYDPYHVVDFCSDAIYFEIMEGNGIFVFGNSQLK